MARLYLKWNTSARTRSPGSRMPTKQSDHIVQPQSLILLLCRRRILARLSQLLYFLGLLVTMVTLDDVSGVSEARPRQKFPRSTNASEANLTLATSLASSLRHLNFLAPWRPRVWMPIFAGSKLGSACYVGLQQVSE